MTAALEGGEWSAARPGRTLPPGKTRYPFYRRLGGPQGLSGRAENLVHTGIRSRTVQPIAQSLYRLSYPAHFNVFICPYVLQVHLCHIISEVKNHGIKLKTIDLKQNSFVYEYIYTSDTDMRGFFPGTIQTFS